MSQWAVLASRKVTLLRAEYGVYAVGCTYCKQNIIQGGSNMTGTCAACLHTNQSRSYLNHLVCIPLDGPGVDSASNRNLYQEYFLAGKGGRCLGLTTLPPSCADNLEIWEPQPPGKLWFCSRPVLELLYLCILCILWADCLVGRL